MAISLRTAAFAALTLASLTGCAGLTDVLAAGIPSAAPSAGASTAPGANTNANSNTNTNSGTTTSNPKPSSAPTGAAACTREKDDSEKDNGTPKLGAYDNQWLPQGWVAAYNSEAQVTAAIADVKDADWDCFQKFYPGATTVFLRTNVRK